MSLFAAYAEQSEKPAASQTSDEKWLENSSFQVNVDLLPQKLPGNVSKLNELVISSDESEVEPVKRRKKEKKKKHKSDRKAPTKVDEENDEFRVDKTRSKELLTVTTISRPSAPKFHHKYFLTLTKRRRKHKFKRYFQHLMEKNLDKSNSDEEKLTKQNLHKTGLQEKDSNFTGLRQEEELSQTTAVYNKTLGEDPNDIKTWLKYIKFQDTIYQFEKTYRKGSIAKALRVLAERKLCILDKALTHNPNCEELLRERLNICVSVFPADELQVQLKLLVEKEQGNLILWQGYIEASQCSMSHCNTPSVLELYTKCLSTLHKLRRNATIEKPVLEESILRMLYQCGLFLKQAGLFEQLWTLLRMYLELNLSPSDDKKKFNISSGFNEKQLVELEEVVFNSQLPLHELWLRTEKLRESCHWMPYLGEGECEDPQRLVFTEDVAELIHPITMPENVFKLTATVLSLLKVPLLPCRHSTMQDLGLDYVPWSLDSIEPLLPLFFPVLYPLNLDNKNLLNDNRLAVGPQYLKVLPGQEEFLEFVLTIMKNCAECLKDDDKTAVTIWWFRFQRLLIVLDKQGRFKMPEYFKKRIKANVKNLLKLEEHRNNELFYLEYALIEKEFGNSESCFKIIKTAIAMNKNKEILAQNWGKPQAMQCFLYRNLIEITLEEPPTDNTAILPTLVNFVLQRNAGTSPDSLEETLQKLKLITGQLLEEPFPEKLTAVQHFLPNFTTDWLTLHGWFLYLTKGPIECGAFLEDTLAVIQDDWQQEVLYEFYVAILFKYCLGNPGCGIFKVLDDVLLRAVAKFPNNLFLLAVIAKEQSMVNSMGQQWWKLKDLLLKTGRAYSTLFATVLASQRILRMEETLLDTVTGGKYQIDSSFKNQMLSLFKRITKPDMCTRRCGLVWRLYLQFVHNYFSPDLCRNVYYSAVEECPWVKALYIDAAIYIPAELPQIQDLIIEKQLRLHVTPEELDVLRS